MSWRCSSAIAADPPVPGHDRVPSEPGPTASRHRPTTSSPSHSSRQMLLRRDMDRDRDEHIDMTPMVDVVFQLMTFMLFTVQMSGGEKVDVPPARHGVGVEETSATFLTLTKPSAMEGESRLLLGHGAGPVATLD